MSQLIIAFGNKARHGKNSAAEVIEEFCATRGIPTKVIGFADAVRIEANTAIEEAGGTEAFFKRRAVYGELKKIAPEGYVGPVVDGVRVVIPPNATMRVCTFLPDWVTPDPNPDKSHPLMPHGKHPKLLQWWGTEYRRSQKESYWVDALFKAIEGFQGVVLITDMRFENEAAAVKQRGGVTVRITRLNPDGSLFYATDRPKDHISETALDNYNWDYQLTHRTGEQAWLEEQALTLFHYVRARTPKEPIVIAGPSAEQHQAYLEQAIKEGRLTFTLPKAA